MGDARHTVVVELRGKEYRLRENLTSIDDIETMASKGRDEVIGYQGVTATFEREETVRIGWLRGMFIAYARAGGNPLTADLIADLNRDDVDELAEGVKALLLRVGRIVKADPDTEGNADAAGAEAKPPSPPRGESGSESPSESSE